MILTEKFPLYPNRNQIDLLWKHSNILTRLYNHFLDQRDFYYQIYKKNLELQKLSPKPKKDKKSKNTKNEKVINFGSKSQQQKELILLKEMFPEIRNLHSQVLQQVTDRLDKSMSNYYKFSKRLSATQIEEFKKKSPRKDGKPHGYPKHNSRRIFFDICYPQDTGFKINDSKFITKIYGEIPFYEYRPLNGKIKQARIILENGKWFICFTIEKQIIRNVDLESIVGIDLGTIDFVTTSNGVKFKNQDHSKYFDKVISEIQSKRSKFKQGSRKYKHYCSKIRQLYEMKRRKTNDYLHKLSHALVNTYNTIVAEDLSVKKMSEGKNTTRNKTIRNSCFTKFLFMLNYKANKLILVDPYNTSKKCCRCGKVHNMPLDIRIMNCDCGNILDRDHNAAINILCLGQAYLESILNKSVLDFYLIQEAPAFRQG